MMSHLVPPYRRKAPRSPLGKGMPLFFPALQRRSSPLNSFPLLVERFSGIFSDCFLPRVSKEFHSPLPSRFRPRGGCSPPMFQRIVPPAPRRRYSTTPRKIYFLRVPPCTIRTLKSCTSPFQRNFLLLYEDHIGLESGSAKFELDPRLEKIKHPLSFSFFYFFRFDL